MGVRAWHIKRAEYNKSVADHLRHQTEFEDWSLVTLFYSSLHFVDSVLADDPSLPKDERNPRKHTGAVIGQRGRTNLVRAQFPANVHRAYRSLEELSRRTRYDAAMLRTESQTAYDKALTPWAEIERFARMMHMTRPALGSEVP